MNGVRRHSRCEIKTTSFALDATVVNWNLNFNSRTTARRYAVHSSSLLLITPSRAKTDGNGVCSQGWKESRWNNIKRCYIPLCLCFFSLPPDVLTASWQLSRIFGETRKLCSARGKIAERVLQRCWFCRRARNYIHVDPCVIPSPQNFTTGLIFKRADKP